MHRHNSGRLSISYGGAFVPIFSLVLMIIFAQVAYSTPESDLKIFHKKIADFNRAIKASPRDPSLHEQRGKCLMDAKYEKEALDDFNVAAFLGSKNYMLYEYRADLYIQHQRYPLAIKSLDEAVRLRPSDPGCWYLRGMANGQAKRYKESVDDCTESIRLAPNNGIAYAIRGFSYERLGQRLEAAIEMQKAKDLGVSPKFLMAIH